jgi:rubredoxin
MCPLCLAQESSLFDQDKFRSYLKCSTCGLVFVPRDSLISEDQEKERYEAHENGENQSGYIQYLSKIGEAIKPFLNEGDRGLDFGCGKTKLLAGLLAPHHVSSYDVYFHPQHELLNVTYDFVILSEVIEHLRDPRKEMLKLSSPKIFIKTKFYPEVGFNQWFYKRDKTHIQFFNPGSFDELAKINGYKSWEKIGEDLYCFKK